MARNGTLIKAFLLSLALSALLCAVGCARGLVQGLTAAGSTTPSTPPPHSSDGTVSVSILANPSPIFVGQSTTLSWQSQGAMSVSIDQGIGPVAASGSLQVQPTATTTYTITAVASSKNVQAASTVSVQPRSPVPGGTLKTTINHVIFMLQENRSYDSYFGRMGEYRQQRGVNDPIDDVPLNVTLFDLEGDGVQPYHQESVCVENLERVSLQQEIDSGKMDAFVKAVELPKSSSIDPKGTRVMGYYDWTDFPFYYELAFQFATSDRYFSSALAFTPTNRMFLFAGSSFGSLNPFNPPPQGWPYPTIFRALTNAGISWRYYYQDTDIFLNDFQDRQLKPGHMFPISQYFIDLHDEATFPQVVFIERAGSTGLDEHPPTDVQRGAAVVAHILDSLMASPAWPSSVFFLSWDESGGFYDHVPPAAAVPPDNLSPKLFSTTGMRVPVVVLSPWVKPHFVSHITRDHTSILKFIETRFGLAPLTKRDASADDMTEFFDFTEPHWIDPPILPSQPVDGKCDHTLEKAPGF